MLKASQLLRAAGLVLTLASLLTAQTDSFVGPELLNSPSIFIPDEAERSGFGGLVRVRLSIDEDGNISSVEDVAGPGWTCPQVTRPDVVAMREAATKAAMLGKFRPATLNGTPRSSYITLNFDFPLGESTEERDISSEVPDSVAASGSLIRDSVILSAKSRDTGMLDGPLITATRNDKFVARRSRTRRSRPPLLSGGVLNGKALELAKPVWPVPIGISATVHVSVLIDTNGVVLTAKTVSGHGLFRFASRSAACKSKFSPVVLSSGEKAQVYGFITYTFTKR